MLTEEGRWTFVSATGHRLSSTSPITIELLDAHYSCEFLLVSCVGPMYFTTDSSDNTDFNLKMMNGAAECLTRNMSRLIVISLLC